MSYTEIYSLSKNHCNKIGEIKNAWRGAMYVWSNIAEKYFGLESFPFLDEAMQKRIWNAGNEHPLTDDELIVLASTMDRVTVKAKDIHRLVEAFDKYAEGNPNSSIAEQALVIKSAEIPDDSVIAFNQTSVGDFAFSPERNEDNDEYIYSDLSGSWDLFEQFDAIKASKDKVI